MSNGKGGSVSRECHKLPPLQQPSIRANSARNRKADISTGQPPNSVLRPIREIPLYCMGSPSYPPYPKVSRNVHDEISDVGIIDQEKGRPKSNFDLTRISSTTNYRLPDLDPSKGVYANIRNTHQISKAPTNLGYHDVNTSFPEPVDVVLPSSRSTLSCFNRNFQSCSVSVQSTPCSSQHFSSATTNSVAHAVSKFGDLRHTSPATKQYFDADTSFSSPSSVYQDPGMSNSLPKLHIPHFNSTGSVPRLPSLASGSLNHNISQSYKPLVNPSLPWLTNPLSSINGEHFDYQGRAPDCQNNEICHSSYHLSTQPQLEQVKSLSVHPCSKLTECKNDKSFGSLIVPSYSRKVNNLKKTSSSLMHGNQANCKPAPQTPTVDINSYSKLGELCQGSVISVPKALHSHPELNFLASTEINSNMIKCSEVVEDRIVMFEESLQSLPDVQRTFSQKEIERKQGRNVIRPQSGNEELDKANVPTWDENLIIHYGFPRNDDDVQRYLQDTPGLYEDNLSLLRSSLSQQLRRVRSVTCQFFRNLGDVVDSEVVIRGSSDQEVEDRVRNLVAKFCKVRKEIIRKFSCYVRNRKWIENVATRQRRGCLSHRQNNVLRLWLFANFDNPYPQTIDKELLTCQTRLSLTQVNNWLINARSRVWKPTLEVMSGDSFRNCSKSGFSRCNSSFVGIAPVKAHDEGKPLHEGESTGT